MCTSKFVHKVHRGFQIKRGFEGVEITEQHIDALFDSMGFAGRTPEADLDAKSNMRNKTQSEFLQLESTLGRARVNVLMSSIDPDLLAQAYKETYPE